MLVFCTSPRLKQKGQKTEQSPAVNHQITQTAENPVSTPAPTPEPFIAKEVNVCGKTFSTDRRKLDLSNITKAEVESAAEIFSQMPYLEYVDIGSEENGLGWEELDRLYSAAPDAKFSYSFSLYGQELNTYDRILDFNHTAMEDEGAAVRAILPYMRNCKTLDMDTCGVSNEAMASIRDEYPEIEVIWRIWFGYNYSVRTNVTKILASKPSVGGDIHNDDAQLIGYCTKLRFLDLGHNEELSDFSFLSKLTDLRYAVLSITALEDLSPIENCTKLYYLEAGNTKISNLKPLAGCTNLEHLNIGTCFDVKDISPLYDLNLKRLWLGVGDPVPEEQVAKMRELHPGIEIDTTCPTGLEGGAIGLNEGFVLGKWKSYKQYLAADWQIKEWTGYFPAQHPKGVFRVCYDGFEYGLNPACYSFPMYDPLYEPHESIYGNTRGEPVSFDEVPENGQIILLTEDKEHLEQWNILAQTYQSQTGVELQVKTGAATEEILDSIDAPTLFEVKGAFSVRPLEDHCLELSDSDAYHQLTSPEYALKKDGHTLGIARNITNYGVLVNLSRLKETGHSLEEIKDYDSFRNIVEGITLKRNVDHYYAAFVSGAMGSIEEQALTTRLANIPLSLELREIGRGDPDEIKGAYMDQFHTFWDLCIYNMNCSYYDLSPVNELQRKNEDSAREFLAGDGVFFICGTEIYDYLKKDGRLSDDEIGFIPIYMGIGEESNQGFAAEAGCYWCVNKDAPEQNINATLDFLNWCVTSREGTQAMADMGYEIPYVNAAPSENPLVMKAREYTDKGKVPICGNYDSMPTEAWRDEVNYEMAAYASNLGDWGDVFGEFVTVWKAEYAIK